jgi:hypothetical protein
LQVWSWDENGFSLRVIKRKKRGGNEPEKMSEDLEEKEELT